jgi:AraC-like DNA-binding protein
VRVARTVEELFSRGDDARCYFGRHFMFWAVDRQLGGHAVWGFPDREDAEQYVAVLEVGLDRPDDRPPVLLTDWSGLSGATQEGFEVLRDYFERNIGRIDPAAALVPPPDMLGAIVAGFYDIATESRRPPLFDSLAEACEHVGRPDALETLAEIERLRVAHMEGHAVVDRLRELLAGDEPPTTLAAAAEALGQPSRTLQHRLRRAGTRFRDEHQRARIRRACTLVASGIKLAAVALEVGFSSPQHFATWFKRHTGSTPAQWRAQHKP